MPMAAATEAPERPERRRVLPPTRVLVVFGVLALIVLLLGGYAGNWAWTGFSDNDTLWDWLKLLLLPIAIATLPIWVRNREYMDPRVRIALGVSLLLFVVLVLLGYLVPWKWTGFTGNTLWDWLGLILLPFVITTVRFWSELRPRVMRRHVVVATAIMAAIVGLVFVGYLRPWEWTGFTGNTLWDWIQLVAVPLLFPLVLMPAALGLIGSGIDERKEQAEAEAARARGETPPEADAGAADAPPAAAPTPEPAPAPHGGMATVAVAAIVALVIGGVAGALAFGGDDSSSSSDSASKAKGATAAATPCTAASAKTIATGTEARVVRSGTTVYACANGAAKPVTLSTDAGGSGATAFTVAGGRVAFADRKCAAGGGDCSTLLKLTRLSDGHVFAPQRFKGGKVTKIVATPSGGMAVMVNDPRQLWMVDKAGGRQVASGDGLDPESLALSGGTVYWRGAGGQAQSAQLGPCAAC
jgi:hypothetical protein